MQSKIIKLKNVRLSFPEVWEPRAFAEGQVPKYQASFLLDPENPAHAASIKEIETAAKDLAKKAWVKVPKTYKLCFGYADDHPKKCDYDGYPGKWYIATSSTVKPKLVDRATEPTVKEDGLLYAGCYVNTNITLWPQDHSVGGKGINANLRIIQAYRDGEHFGVAPPSADEMDVIEFEDDLDDDIDDWDDEGDD
jgi:hypothetical protein